MMNDELCGYDRAARALEHIRCAAGDFKPRVAVVLVGVLLLVCSFAFSAWIGPDRLMSAFYLY